MHYLKFNLEGTLIASYNEKKSNIVLRTAFAGEKYPVKMGDSWTFQKKSPLFRIIKSSRALIPPCSL